MSFEGFPSKLISEVEQPNAWERDSKHHYRVPDIERTKRILNPSETIHKARLTEEHSDDSSYYGNDKQCHPRHTANVTYLRQIFIHDASSQVGAIAQVMNQFIRFHTFRPTERLFIERRF